MSELPCGCSPADEPGGPESTTVYLPGRALVFLPADGDPDPPPVVEQIAAGEQVIFYRPDEVRAPDPPIEFRTPFGLLAALGGGRCLEPFPVPNEGERRDADLVRAHPEVPGLVERMDNALLRELELGAFARLDVVPFLDAEYGAAAERLDVLIHQAKTQARR